jgi:hypothetical protein
MKLAMNDEQVSVDESGILGDPILEHFLKLDHAWIEVNRLPTADLPRSERHQITPRRQPRPPAIRRRTAIHSLRT